MNTVNCLKNSLKVYLISIFFIVSASAQAGIVFELSSNDIKVGDTFSIDVVFDNPSQQILAGFAFDINDESLLTVGYLGHTLISADYIASLFPSFDVDIFIDFTAPEVAFEEILLARLNFTANSAGSDTLTVVGNDGLFSGLFLVDSASYEVIYEAIDSNISFNVSEVPEPATLAIMLLALTVLVANQRKRKA